MPVMDGIEATRLITAGPSPARVVVLTTFDDDEYVYAALRAGASGFLVKDMALEEILAAISGITEREREVLTLVGRGLSNTEIAAGLTLSIATVKTYVTRLLTKLDARDRVQLVIIAYDAGLVAPAR